jgi:Tfp pilus assembly protein PilF
MSASTLQRSFAWWLIAACVGCAEPGTKEEDRAASASAPAAAQPAAPAPPAPTPPRAAAPASPSVTKAEQELTRGIRSYEDGERKRAARELQSALDLGLESKRDQARAHKYLAFIVCVSGRERTCRNQFRKALDADPAFVLEPAEAGNPVWSAALSAVKAERAKAKKSK